MIVASLLISLLCILSDIGRCTGEYQPTWESLDSRPIPDWFDEAKFGIFIHWGIFSVPSWAKDGSIAEWYYQRLLTGGDGNATREFHAKTYGPDFSYAEFGPMFKAELWDPAQWAELFKNAGAKFVVLTSKHCDGWANWKSPAKWGYNSVDNGPMRDLVGELTNATRAAGLKMGLYYCNIEWGNPLLPWNYVNGPEPYTGQEKYVEEVFLKELMDITLKYQPSIINGDYCILLNSTQLRSREFLAWLYNESPVKDEVVVDDRWGTDAKCHHGGYWTCTDKFEPNYVPPHKWMDENTIGASWGLNRMETAKNYKTVPELVEMLISNVAYGGNLLLNVGPTSDGRIIPIMEERLLGMGKWLLVNGEAIYGTKIWRNQTEVSVQGNFTVFVNKSNIDFAGIPGPTNSTGAVKYLGKVQSADQCLDACASQKFAENFGQKCLSFTWHSNECPQPQWSSMCYGEMDDKWNPTNEPGHTTGRLQSRTVYYTSSKETPGTVYATMIGLPLTETLSLGLPVSTANTQVYLLSNSGKQSLSWQKGSGSKGIMIEINKLDPDNFPEGNAYVFVLTNVK
eukprot:m.9541 g.9541  ORF g.9541 m.9541 type:complete len:568 (+) comp21418_c0_seq1:182-1885(+)